MSLEGTVGQTAGYGGEYKDRGRLTVAASMRMRIRRFPVGDIVGAATLERVGVLAGDDAVCILGTRGQCLSAYPVLTGTTLGLGLQRKVGARGQLGALAGVGVYSTSRYEAPRERAAAVSGQVDGSLALVPHVALTASAHAVAIRRIEAARLGLRTVAFGLRLF